MSLGELWRVLRWLLGLGLIGLALLLGYVSTALLDINNFRTEGSPAGTIMFVVLLCFPPAALLALICGILLLRRALAEPVAEAAPVRLPAPASAPRRQALWRRHPGGATLGLLLNGDRAVLQYHPPSVGSAWCSHDAGYRGGRAANYPFRCGDGSLVNLPTVWTVPSALALRALAQFEADGERPQAIGWRPCSLPVSPVREAASAWELEVQLEPAGGDQG